MQAGDLGPALYFSVVQRIVLTPNDFTSLDQLRDRLAAFEAHDNAIAKPFNWKFTRTDLDDLLHRIDAHDNALVRDICQAAGGCRAGPRGGGGDQRGVFVLVEST